MEITHCKLTKNTQRRLLEFFVLEVTARSAADFLSIQPHTAAFFYKKIRQVIVYHLALRSKKCSSAFIHERINHLEEFVDDKNHINGIENFWSQAKRHLRKFNGIPKAHFELYLKECEWRFNTVGAKHQLNILKQIVKEKL